MRENPDTRDPQNGTGKGLLVHLAPAGRHVYSIKSNFRYRTQPLYIGVRILIKKS